MIKTTATKLKAKLGKFMQAVREGNRVLVTDRGVVVARLEPAGAPKEAPGLELTQPRDPTAPALGRITVKGVSYRGTDSGALLAEDRRR